jgi:hypothetical protein
MNCLITVTGNGTGRHGNPKAAKTGPLRDFLIDNNVYYRAITKHLLECSICSINDVLKEYLRRRIEIPKFHGMTSDGLGRRAVVLEHLARKKNQVLDENLVDEILWRMGMSGINIHEDRMTNMEIYRAFTIDPLTPKRSDRYQWKPRTLVILNIIRDSDLLPSDETELNHLISIAEVMLT